MRSLIFPVLIVCGLLLSVGQAQQPTPAMVIVQAATAQAQATPRPAVNAAPANSGADAAIQAALKCLQDTKTANAEILRKQEETLQKLDELEKAADQLRIFSKRSGG